MGISVETLAVAKKYTNRSIEGITGALAGKNATIDSITDITGGHRVTFKWTADNGDVRTQTMDVMDGSKGDKGETGNAGLGIKAVNINAQNHLIITYDDDSTYDAGELPGGGEVFSVNGKKGAVTLDANDVGALPDDTAIPSKISDLQNDSDFIEKSATAGLVKNDGTIDTKTYIEAVAGKGLSTNDYDDTEKAKVAAAVTKAVNDLTNYYLKTETYTKTEVDNIAAAIKNSRFEVVSMLPTSDIHTNVIYLLPKASAQTNNAKDEYINLDGTSAGWEKIGDTEIDLSGYVTTTALNTALAAYTTTTDLTALLADKVDKITGKGLSTNDYTNTDKELVDSIPTLAPISLVKDTVGWIGKNLLPYPYKDSAKTHNGVTYVYNSDNTITANGEATSTSWRTLTEDFSFLELGKKYRLSGCPAGGNSNSYLVQLTYNDGVEKYIQDYGDGIEFTYTGGFIRLQVIVKENYTANNLVFKPMICRADITDPTYEPYHESVETMYEEEIHGVNLLKNTASNKTDGNVAWVVNADKSITINTSESASSVQTLYIGEVTGLQGDYILNGVTGGSLSTYGIQLYDVTTSTWITQYAVDGDSTINLADKNHTYRFVAYVRQGVSVSNITIRPMLRKADIEDSTYRPYNEQAIQNQLNAQGVLGAKNFWSWQITNQTRNGITWTQNTDGSVLANGATTNTQSDMYSLKFTFKKAGKYILTGKSNNVEVGLYNFQTSTWYWSNNIHPSILIDVPNTTDEWWFSVVVRTNKTVNNEIIYPMLRLASDPDDTYQPYAMTNRELTEEGPTIKTHQVEWNEDLNLGSSTNKGGSIVQYGKLYFVTYWFKATTALTGNTPIIKLPKNGLTGGNYVITEGNDTAIWGGKSAKDGIDYVSISCPIVVDKVYRSQCVWMDLT